MVLHDLLHSSHCWSGLNVNLDLHPSEMHLTSTFLVKKSCLAVLASSRMSRKWIKPAALTGLTKQHIAAAKKQSIKTAQIYIYIDYIEI